MPRRLPYDEYTVGWVCALAVEQAAAKALLDEEHDSYDASDGQDENIYCTGSIAGHNVVIVCLPAGNIGHTPATATMMQMRATFKKLRFGLMVGVGGGVPSVKADIRLGDIVVSEPRGHFGGIIQYDKGKRTDRGLKPTGHLNSPPRILLNALSIMKSNTLLDKSTLSYHISELEKIPTFHHNRAGPDILFDAEYSHKGDHLTCKYCDVDRQIIRPQRQYEERVAVHYGTIASGNQVIRSATERDKLSADFDGVLCFEMEAAGLLNNLPCLVIRGICDYSDSHKNKRWQPYASATAAAYAKELLSLIPAVALQSTGTTEEALHGSRKRSLEPVCFDDVLSKRTRINRIDDSSSRQSTTITLPSHQRYHYQTSPSIEERTRFLELLRFEQIDARRLTIKSAHAKTCKWILKNQNYTKWLDATTIEEHNGFLWVKGKAGAGKSTLMNFITKKARQTMKDHITLSFFFNARGEKLERSTLGLFRSLLFHLLEKLPSLLDVLDLSDFSPRSSSSVLNIELLQDTLEQAILALRQSSVVCFIDALDECEEEQVRDMIQYFENISAKAVTNGIRLQICFSSRHYPHITISKGLELVLEGQEGHRQDIVNYIEEELRIKKSRIAEQIRAELQEKASGIFMWVVLVVRILNKESDSGRAHLLRQKLREIPADLHRLFQDILTRDSEGSDSPRVDSQLILCIQWVLFAKKMLNPEQLYWAIRSGIKEEILSQWNPDGITEDDIRLFILDCSKGLTEVVSVAKTQRVQFIHESVRDFLLKEDGLSKIWPDLKENFEGQSHERLRECCTNYLANDFASILKIPSDLSRMRPWKTFNLRESAVQRFPFLEYAVQTIFYHANQAERNGIEQARFLALFPLPQWVHLDNLLEKHQIRRHTSNVSWQYILAELNLANLITKLPLGGRCVEENKERYGCVLFAASAMESDEALEVCLRSMESNHTVDIPLMATFKRVIQRSFSYNHKRGVCGSIAEMDIDIILKDTILTFLFKSQPSYIDHVDPCNRTALWWASKCGCNEAVNMLLDTGCVNINLGDEKRGTPLYAAAANCDLAIVVALLQHGADVNVQCGTYGNALQAASATGNKEIVEILLNKGADVNVRGGHYSNALQAASYGGYKEIVEILLNKGADVNAKGGYYGNALQAVLYRGDKEIVEVLLNKGADVNAKGGRYRNALQAASAFRHKEIKDLLLARGALRDPK